MPSCEMHDTVMESFRAGTARMERIEGKLDGIIERQITMVEDIAYVKHGIDNGLKSAVEATQKTCKDFGERLKPIEDFAWFRKGVMDFRDHLFWRILQIVGLVGFIYAVIHFGDEIIKRYGG
jgi:hypothetical protein